MNAWHREGSTRRFSSRRWTLVPLLLVIGVGAASPSAAALGPPPGGPDLSTIAFSAEELPGARIARQGYVKPESSLGFIAEYDRSFSGAPRLSGKRLLWLEDDVALAATTTHARDALRTLGLGLVLAAPEIKKELAKEFNAKPSAVKVGSLAGAGAGEDSFSLRVTIRTRAGEADVLFAGVRVGPVVNFIGTAGAPGAKLGATDTKRLARMANTHSRAGLMPASLSAPLVSGTPQDGQSLGAATGTWSNAPSGYAYQWQRCDSTGTTCTDVPGATAQSYAQTSADVGQTLRVSVTATNRYGSATALSAPTATVSAAPGTTPSPPAP
jgi:hypothetical protein